MFPFFQKISRLSVSCTFSCWQKTQPAFLASSIYFSKAKKISFYLHNFGKPASRFLNCLFHVAYAPLPRWLQKRIIVPELFSRHSILERKDSTKPYHDKSVIINLR